MTALTPVCGFVPMRREPGDRNEMVSQILFGEWAELVHKEGNWLNIKTLFDGYTGWVYKNSMNEGNIPLGEKYGMVCAQVTVATDLHKSCSVLLPSGSVLQDYAEGHFTANHTEYRIENTDDTCIPGKDIDIEETGKSLLSVPYLWGGRCGFGFDCSGLTQHLCRLKGISVPRDAGMQSLVGQTINFVNEAKKGDLLFFDNEEGAIVHTGIVLEPGKVLHASGKVRIDRFDHQGIFNSESGAYSHKLRVIKRV